MSESDEDRVDFSADWKLLRPVRTTSIFAVRRTQTNVHRWFIFRYECTKPNISADWQVQSASVVMDLFPPREGEDSFESLWSEDPRKETTLQGALHTTYEAALTYALMRVQEGRDESQRRAQRFKTQWEGAHEDTALAEVNIKVLESLLQKEAQDKASSERRQAEEGAEAAHAEEGAEAAHADEDPNLIDDCFEDSDDSFDCPSF